MDKDQDIESTEHHEEPIDEVIEDVHEPEIQTEKVVVKKSGGGFALFLALIALGLSGYLFYKDWLANADETNHDAANDVLQQLNAQKSLSAKTSQQLQQQIDQLTQTLSQIETNLNDLKTELATNTNEPSTVLGQPVTFDNSSNEAAIQTLKEQIADQNETLKSLQKQLATQPANVAAFEANPNQFDELQKNAAIQSLVSAQTLLNSGHIEMAASTLEYFLQSSTIDSDYLRKIQNKINQINQIKQPDSNQLSQELSAIGTAIKDLTLPTKNTEETESSWYDRFISVKKIDEGDHVDSSFELLSLKAELSNRLNAVKLLLTLKDQQGWQHALNQAAELLQQNMPQQQAMINQLQKLAGEPIAAIVPENLALMSLVDELKGMR